MEALKSPSHTSTETVLGYLHRNTSPSHLPLSLPPELALPSSSLEGMAYQRSEPRSFAPHGFELQEVQHILVMAHEVLRPTPHMHEDFAIVSISPFLQMCFTFQ
jgi:hypothetical protein